MAISKGHGIWHYIGIFLNKIKYTHINLVREDPGMAFGVWQSWLCDLWEIHLPFKPVSSSGK